MDKSNQILAAVAANLGAFALGSVLAYTSPAESSMKEDKFTELTKEEASWIGAIAPLGALCSAPVCGFLMNQIGRKLTMIILSAPFVVGWLLVAFAQNIPMMLAGRFLSGFCGGGYSLVAPVFIGETADDSIRGALGSGFQLFVVIGILMVNILGLAVNWKWLAVICACVPVGLVIAVVFIRESPRYLVMKGKTADASRSLCWYRKKKSSQDVEGELNLIEASVNEDKAQKAKLSDLLISYNLRPSLIMLGLMLFQQLSGINAVIFYTSTIFEAAGSSMDSSVSSIIVCVIQVVATGVAALVVDKLGRKILLVVSDAIMCGSLVVLGLYFKLQDDEKANGIGWLPLVSLMLFISAFSIGFGPLPWMMLGELLPPKIKGLVASMSTMFNWFLAFLVTKFFTNIQDFLGKAGCYWMFAVICGLGTVFVVLFVPETKGKSIEEIQRAFGAPISEAEKENKEKGQQT